MFKMMETDEVSEGNADLELPEAAPWSESDMLAAEKELIGFYISGHPLARYEWELDKFALTRMKDIQTLESGARTRVGGMIVETRKLFTKKDQKPMATFQRVLAKSEASPGFESPRPMSSAIPGTAGVM